MILELVYSIKSSSAVSNFGDHDTTAMSLIL